MKVVINDYSNIQSIIKEDKWGPFYNIIITYKNGSTNKVKYDDYLSDDKNKQMRDLEFEQLNRNI